jgi:hypothetical protein
MTPIFAKQITSNEPIYGGKGLRIHFGDEHHMNVRGDWADENLPDIGKWMVVHSVDSCEVMTDEQYHKKYGEPA